MLNRIVQLVSTKSRLVGKLVFDKLSENSQHPDSNTEMRVVSLISNGS